MDVTDFNRKRIIEELDKMLYEMKGYTYNWKKYNNVQVSIIYDKTIKQYNEQ
jgi:hypothetical protein